MSKYMSVKQVAMCIRLSERSVRRLITEGHIPSEKIAGRRLVPKAWFQETYGRGAQVLPDEVLWASIHMFNDADEQSQRAYLRRYYKSPHKVDEAIAGLRSYRRP